MSEVAGDGQLADPGAVISIDPLVIGCGEGALRVELAEPEAGLLPALQSAQVTGSTAVAPAISDLAGRGELPVVAVPDDDGWRLSGTIGWASNLFDDAVVVAPGSVRDGGAKVTVGAEV